MMPDRVLWKSLAARYGTPLWVYDAATLDARIDAWRTALPEAHLHYAVKANGNLALLQRIARAGLGFDVVSAGELARVERAGGDARPPLVQGAPPRGAVQVREHLGRGQREDLLEGEPPLLPVMGQPTDREVPPVRPGPRHRSVVHDRRLRHEVLARRHAALRWYLDRTGRAHRAPRTLTITCPAASPRPRRPSRATAGG